MQLKSAILTTTVFALTGSTLAARGSPTTAAATPEETCLSSCKPGDVMCQAACVGTAHPDPNQANATIQCVRNTCHQGDGSAAASAAYSQCVQKCIDENFPTSQSGVPTVAVPTPTPVMSSTVVTSVVPTGTGQGSGKKTGPGEKAGPGSKAGTGSGPGSKAGSGSAPSSKPAAKSGSGPSGSSTPPKHAPGSASSSGSAPKASANAASSTVKMGASFVAIAAVFVATLSF